MSETKKRYHYLDLLRILACVSVIFNHTGETGFLAFSLQPAFSLRSWIYAAVSILTSINVPLFFMISGVTLLKKEESLKKTYMRILRFVLLIVIFSGLLCIRDILRGQEWTPVSFLKHIFSYNYSYTYWYLYYYIAFLMITPLLRSMVSNLQDKYFLYMFFLTFAFSLNSALSEGVTRIFLNESLNINWFYQECIMFPFFGYYLHHRLDRERLRTYLPVLVVLSAVCLLLMTGLTLSRQMALGYMDETTLAYHRLFRYLFAITVFALFRYYFEEKEFSHLTGKIVSYLSSLTLGIYLLHEPIIHMNISYRVLDVFLSFAEGTMIPGLMISVYTFAAAAAVTAVMKLVPGLKRIL